VWWLRNSLNNSGVCNQDKSLVSWNQSSLNKSFRSSPVIPAKAGIQKSLSGFRLALPRTMIRGWPE